MSRPTSTSDRPTQSPVLLAVILQFCDMGNLTTAIAKGVFQTQGLNTEEARLRFRALLRSVREVSQVRVAKQVAE